MDHVLSIPKDAREAFCLMRKRVGAKPIADILDCSLPYAYKMGASKKTNGETRNDPFTQAYRVGKEMIKQKLFEALYVSVFPLVELMGGTIAFENRKPDKNHYREEMLDLSVAVADLMHTCELYINHRATRNQIRFEEKNVHDQAGQLVEMAIIEKKRIRADQ